jgi:hypothetical protein
MSVIPGHLTFEPVCQQSRLALHATKAEAGVALKRATLPRATQAAAAASNFDERMNCLPRKS